MGQICTIRTNQHRESQSLRHRGIAIKSHLRYSGVLLVVASLLVLSEFHFGWAATDTSQIEGELDTLEFNQLTTQQGDVVDLLTNPGFWFEDIGFGSVVVYQFGFDAATGSQIGVRGQFFPYMSWPIVTGFAWNLQGPNLTLTFSSSQFTIQLLQYDPELDILSINGQPGNAPVWHGCRSPYIPAGISPSVVAGLCQ